jgi:hypothetical protein
VWGVIKNAPEIAIRLRLFKLGLSAICSSLVTQLDETGIAQMGLNLNRNRPQDLYRSVSLTFQREIKLNRIR